MSPKYQETEVLFTDLNELKSIFEIDPDDTIEDMNLGFYTEQASQWIEEVLNRPGFSYASRTEIYKGTGTPKLLLRSRPVYATPTIQVFHDSGANFNSSDDPYNDESALTYGQHFCLDIDTGTNKSRSGILYKIGDAWIRPSYRQMGYLSPFLGPDRGSLKIIYTGGYTVDDLPAGLRLACNLLVSKIRACFPIGMELSSEGYEERSLRYVTSQKEKLLSLVKPLIMPYRNWKF